jgi:hypothetical protein
MRTRWPSLADETAQLFQRIALAEGIQSRITSTVRTRDEQARLFKLQGASGLAAEPGNSTHEYGIAFDLVATDPRNQGALGKLAVDYGITWGGTFSRPDVVHFQLLDAASWRAWLASTGRLAGIAALSAVPSHLITEKELYGIVWSFGAAESV